jgi:nucleotidyltransferase substrate binding protein (TIGR01987 family)
MDEGLSRRVDRFEQALIRLDEALVKPEDAIVRDASIQRFEFTFEMAWKAIQRFAFSEGVECVSPRDCFRAGFRLGLLANDARWMAMVEDRNRTVHTYDEKSARAIYQALPEYGRLLRQLLEKLKQAREGT